MLRDFSATLHSLCLGLLKKHFFVTSVLCKEGMTKVSEEKKNRLKKPYKVQKNQAQLSTTVHNARGQRRLTEEELGTSQPFPCTTTTRWPSAVHHRRRTPTPRRRHRLCCMSRRERRAARCPKLRSQSAPSLLRTEPS